MSDTTAETPDLIEGLDEPTGTGWGDYPLDSVFVRNETRTVAEVISRIDKKRYVLDPDFQRDFVWPEDKQSKLIESCVMRIPLPVFYLAEAKDGRIIVVDGLQRLTTFDRFVKGHLRLRGLVSNSSPEAVHSLEGKRFNDLPLRLQERILDTQIITYILDAKAPERARLDIFERVNSGVPLTRQQMRNALYNGPATNFLKDASHSDLFRQATGRSLDPKTMRDREAVNRFCAFSVVGWSAYRSGDMDGFLANILEKMNHGSVDMDALIESLNNSLLLNRQLFGEHAFRKSLLAQDPYARRNVLNIALFDVCTVLFAKYYSVIAGSDSAMDLARFMMFDLIDDVDFSIAITYSTNSTNAVRTRFEMANERFAEAFS